MSEPATPTKRVLTEDAHSALHAPRLPYGNFISDDLTARLQNLGSRVRKCVNEGYSTQRFGGIPSVSPTPYSSPVKSATAATPSRNAHIFRSANDTILDVFSSPARAKSITQSPSPSPRKRGHAELELQDEHEESSAGTTINTQDGVQNRAGMEATSDDEDIMIITDANSNCSPNRPIRPLRKTARMHRPPDPLTNTACATDSSSDAGPCLGEPTPPSSEWKNMFNQEF